jgi:hypothetical protein
MSHAMANSDVLDRLLAAVRDVLDVDVPEASVSFLDLDGDSLSAIIVAETLRDEGLGLKVEDLLSTRPLTEVAGLVREAS